MIRKATPSDTPALVDLCIEALNLDAYSQLVPSKERTFLAVQECVSSAMNFAWVAEKDGQIVGGLGALVMPFMMYERNQCIITMWYCRKPGDGIMLLNQFMKWIETRPIIKQVIYTEERKSDPRIAKALKKVGFQDNLPMHVLTR